MRALLPKPGKYVVAVSGGVDSMVLLDLLAKKPELDLVVAHVDHGIRPDSHLDRELVESVAGTLSVPLVCLQAKLGASTSEAKAREVRYTFLNQVKKDKKAIAIITAHHQDDLIETAILNMLRGTGRKGLTSLGSNKDLIRPLLNIPKADLIKYAQDNQLTWREDSTNSDEKYLRNYIRLNYTNRLTPPARLQLLKVVESMKSTNEELDDLLVKYLKSQPAGDSIDRQWFSQLPHNVSREILATWLRSNEIRDFDSKTLERLVVAAKTGQAGKTFPVVSGYNVRVSKDRLTLDKSGMLLNTREKV